MALLLRDWQSKALNLWVENGFRGIISAVTGGGKTVLALEAIRRSPTKTTLIVVPTLALLEQWWEEAASYFSLKIDEVHIVRARGRLRRGTINIAVINTASTMRETLDDCLLVVDECHKAASEHFSAVLAMGPSATLGLSATPERQYDDGLNEILVPALGPVLMRYTYREALRDKVIVPFRLHNIVFDLEPETRAEYDRLTRRLARSVESLGIESPETLSILLRRARVLNLSHNRVRITLKLIARQIEKRVLVFHEDIAACDVIQQVLLESGVRSGVYHSKLPIRSRAMMLSAYRAGDLDVLVTCRA